MSEEFNKLEFHKFDNIDKRSMLMYYSFAQILESYKQPDWCGKHEALNGIFGCNELLGLTQNKINKDFCSKCKDFKNEI